MSARTLLRLSAGIATAAGLLFAGLSPAQAAVTPTGTRTMSVIAISDNAATPNGTRTMGLGTNGSATVVSPNGTRTM